jgi:hypothetical protein
MSRNAPESLVIPDEKTPRLFGTLNIVFGSVLLLCNLIQGGFYVAAPMIKNLVETWQVQLNATFKTQAETREAELKRRVVAAKTEADKAQAQADLDAYLAQPKPNVSTMTMGFQGMEDRRIRAYAYTEMLSGIVLNTLMIVSGAALLSLKAWGRKWAVAIAGIKLARLAALVTVSIAMVIPLQVKAMEGQMQGAMAQVKAAPGGAKVPALAFMTPQAMSAMSTAGVILNAIAAAIYPAMVLVMLTKARVKAACRDPKPRSEEDLA